MRTTARAAWTTAAMRPSLTSPVVVTTLVIKWTVVGSQVSVAWTL